MSSAPRLIPGLFYEDPNAAVEWLAKAFGPGGPLSPAGGNDWMVVGSDASRDGIVPTAAPRRLNVPPVTLSPAAGGGQVGTGGHIHQSTDVQSPG